MGEIIFVKSFRSYLKLKFNYYLIISYTWVSLDNNYFPLCNTIFGQLNEINIMDIILRKHINYLELSMKK